MSWNRLLLFIVAKWYFRGPCLPQKKARNVFLLEVAIKNKTIYFASERTKGKEVKHLIFVVENTKGKESWWIFFFCVRIQTQSLLANIKVKVYFANSKIPLQYTVFTFITQAVQLLSHIKNIQQTEARVNITCKSVLSSLENGTEIYSLHCL